MNFLQVSTCVNGFSFCLVDNEGLDFFLHLLRDQDFFLVCFFFFIELHEVSWRIGTHSVFTMLFEFGFLSIAKPDWG